MHMQIKLGPSGGSLVIDGHDLTDHTLADGLSIDTTDHLRPQVTVTFAPSALDVEVDGELAVMLASLAEFKDA